jgi:hypothetical protein
MLRCILCRTLACLAWLASLQLFATNALAVTAVDEESPWPRVRATNGHTVTLHLPEVERWTSNSFTARAPVEVKLAGSKKELLGVVWFEARGKADHSNRVVTLDSILITKGRFPEATDGGSNALAVIRDVIPSGVQTVSLDYLITALGFVQAAARQGPSGLKHNPPRVLWATNYTVLVRIDGQPVFRPIEGTSVERVVNTPALLVRDAATGRLYLSGGDSWFSAPGLDGPWSLSQTPPGQVAALASPSPAASGKEPPPARPEVVVTTTPTELLATSGMPEFRPIKGTSLEYAADSDNQLFFHTKDREAYVLLSGRWYKAASLQGPWTYVRPRDLPEDFAKIPPGSAHAIVRASVPGTPEAELALLANSVPTTATVRRSEAKIQLAYDGEPQFKPIEGTPMSYAINADCPVIQTDKDYYALANGVWFAAKSATGPWEVATEVPEDIYTIPPSSPVYYATYARVYDFSEEEVQVGYTSGAQGAYEDDGTVVYGTGYDYESWCGDYYYGWGWTWGYGYCYVPWYQWWVWRPWWSQPGGLRAAVIDNIYDRWGDGNGVVHYDTPVGDGRRATAAAGFNGYPALYGRFKGSPTASAMIPPANTVAFNPYSRPGSAARPGDIPRGAQMLRDVRTAPGSGRDLYASRDGSVYLRKSDGWYRRGIGGSWAFYAPAQGRIKAQSAATVRRDAPSASGGVAYRPVAGAADIQRNQAWANRAPDAGVEARRQEVAELERQYYARSIAQYRANNSRPHGSYNRGGRAGGGRRR